MLVRTLCRLAAAAPRRTLLARAPVALTPARAAAAVHLLSRHGYATKSSATESTDTVKKAVKKAVKAKATGKATSKAAPKKAKKKAAPKKAKKAAPKKAAPRTKKELTPEEEYKKKYYALRSTALLKDQPMGERTLSTHSVFIGDFLKGNENATSQMGAANEKFRNLTPAEREHWNHVAQQLKEARAAEARAWVESHTPAQIQAANNARSKMRNMLEKSPVKLIKFKNLSAIPDERRITRPRSAWLLFMQDRVNDSDFDGIAMIERTKLVASEWRALSESEKKVYLDRSLLDQQRYHSESAELKAKYNDKA